MKTVAWIVPKAGGMAGPTGFEPATSRLTIWRPNQAERRPHATQDGGRRIQIVRIKLSKYSSAYSCTSLLMDKAMPRAQFPVFLIGRRNRDRTCDLCLVRAALSQLSYPPVFSRSRQIFGMLSTPPSSVNQESCIILAGFLFCADDRCPRSHPPPSTHAQRRDLLRGKHAVWTFFNCAVSTWV